MDEKVIIEFAKWITGHDEETIIQMYDDWASSPARQAIQVQAVVKVQIASIEEKYNELIMAVAKKFTNETRHETALRYIKEAEKLEDNTPCKT